MAEIVCRICLEQPKAPLKLVWPLEDQYRENTYASMFTEVSGFPVFENEPQAICGGCRLQLIYCFGFKMKCQRSQQIIMSYVEVKDEITEDIKEEPSPIEAGQPLDAQVRDVDVVKVLDPLSKPVEVFDLLSKPVETAEGDAWNESLERVEATDEVMEDTLDGDSTNQSFTGGGDDLLEEMEVEEEPTKKFRCNSCEYAVNSPHPLERHLKKFHPELENSCCPCCGALVFSELKQFHLETCSKNPALLYEAQQNDWLTCPYCGDQSKWFRCEKSLLDHSNKKHKRQQRKKIFCRLCNKRCKLELLPRHERECKDYPVECPHCQQSVPFNKQENHLKDCSQNPANKEEALFNNYVTCEACGKTSKWYKDSEKLLAHKIADHRHYQSVWCQYCRKACYPEHLEKHESSCSKNPVAFEEKAIANEYLSCDHCFPTKIWCKTLGSLERHLKEAHPERQTAACQYCRRLKFPELLADHEDECSFKQMKRRKTRLCPVCGKLVNATFLNQHIALVHERKSSGPRPQFICDLCNRHLPSKSSIQNHMDVYHLKLVACNFVCSICGLTFHKYEQLSTHRRNAHPDKYPRFKCSQCNFTCAKSSSLKNHERRHLGEAAKDYECLTCGRKFYNSNTLRNHEAIHAEKGSFACRECSKVFKTQRRLTIHTENVHLGLKPYECPVCQRKFGSNQNMRLHATNHHPEYQLPPQGTVMRKTSKIITNICVPVSKM